MKSLSFGHLKAGIDSVRSAKLRSFWTTLGVIIGVTSVIVIVSIGAGIKQQISGQIHHFGKNLIIIRPAQLQSDTSKTDLSLISGLSTTGPLTDKDVTTVSQITGLAASAPLTIASGTIRGDSTAYTDGLVIGTTSDLPGLLNQSMAYGSFISDDDGAANVVVLGQHASEVLFDEDVPLGRSLTFRGQRFIVRGIFNQFTAAPLSRQADFNNAIFIPHQIAEKLSNNTAPTYEILARASDESKSASVITAIDHALAKTHGGQNSFSIQSGEQNLESSNTILELLTRLIAGVAAISLLVSGIGIMNVMLVSVAERKQEIGIRKAVGATNRQILGQFMIESSVLSLAGGVIGVGLAFVIDLLLRVLTDLQPTISWQVVALASGVSLLVGIVFGSVPALKAALKDPIEALRSE